MKPVKFNPFFPAPTKGLSNFAEDFFNRSISDFVGSDFFLNQPSVNVVEKEDHFRMEVAAPGLKKEDFKIDLDGDYLTVSAKKEQKEEVKDERYTRREFNFQSFQRSFTLPENVNTDKVAATYENGVLVLSLPKKETEAKETTRTIEIK
ncbi:MAG TPA: Hsp20/alpha crystallin family protein [Saprospiraceae bacterium]|nr:Hsp20/alpha crystallin family protein [Saprospiraceae bacterium]